MPARFSRHDNLLCRLAWRRHTGEEAELLEVTRRDLLQRALFPGAREGRAIVVERLEAWRRFARLADRTGESSILDDVTPFTVWAYAFAVAQLIRSRPGKIIGFAGPPGSGKTTLTALVASCIRSLDSKARVARAALDDFYLSRSERLEKGLKWRAQPGTHDIEGVARTMGEVLDGKPAFEIPRFDPVRDGPGDSEKFAGPASFLLLDGWFLGRVDDGYDRIRRRLDYLIYLNCSLRLAKRRRFRRESILRAGGRGGLSEEEMQRFWREILAPGTEEWVLPIRRVADLVIDLDDSGRPVAARRRRGLPALLRLPEAK